MAICFSWISFFRKIKNNFPWEQVDVTAESLFLTLGGSICTPIYKNGKITISTFHI